MKLVLLKSVRETFGTTPCIYTWFPFDHKWYTLIMPHRFESPTEGQSQNITKLPHTVESFCDRYPSYKIQQNSFNYRRVSDFSCEKQYFSWHRCCKNSWFLLGWLPTPFQFCHPYLLQIPSICDRISKQIGNFVALHKPYLKLDDKIPK